MGVRDIEVTAAERKDTPPKQTWFAAGGVIGAVLASSCCIAPLLLRGVGASARDFHVVIRNLGIDGPYYEGLYQDPDEL
jgi:hypothetical protein